MSEESSKQASKQAVASNLVQPSKVMISKQGWFYVLSYKKF
jgi:hypothetical protein